MPRNIGRLDLTRPERRALLGRLLDIIDGDEAVNHVYWHAKHAAEALAKSDADPGMLSETRDALVTEALTSARAALPGLQALVRLAEAELEHTRATEEMYRRWHDEKPSLWQSYESRLDAATESIRRALAHVEEMRAIIDAHAPDAVLAEQASLVAVG